MTHLIDINLQSDRISNPSYCKSFYNRSRLSTATNLHGSVESPLEQNFMTFLHETKDLEFDLMFQIKQNTNHTFINIYLLQRNAQIFKLDNQVDRTYLIRYWIGLKSLYVPCIDPLTGFVYFRIGYFSRDKHAKELKIQELMKKISLEKLYKSVKKLSKMNLRMEGERLVQNIWGEEKSYLQLSKIVARLIQSNDLQSIFIERSQNKLNNLPQNLKKLNQISSAISLFSQILEPKKTPQNRLSNKKISSLLTSFSEQHTNLTQIVKRKAGRSNFDTLLINQSSSKQFQQLIQIMLSTNSLFDTFKTAQADLGKITLNLERNEQKIFYQKINFLQSLPKQSEYHFLDKYFKTGLNVPILVTLSLKQQSLSNFLQTNKMTMSLQTRLRLILQVYSAVTTLWEENKIILFVNSLDKIYVTKNLSVKMRGIERFYKPDHHVLLEQKSLVNLKIAENLLNLAKLYFKIFFNYPLLYLQPSNVQNTKTSIFDICRKEGKLQKLIHPLVLSEGPFGKGLKNFMTGLGYIFDAHINIARKFIDKNVKKLQMTKKDVFKLNSDDQPEQQNDQVQNQPNEEDDQRLLSYKYTCCWLMKILDTIAKDMERIL